MPFFKKDHVSVIPNGVIRRADFFGIFKKIDFKPYKPTGNVWTTAYVSCQRKTVMMVLVRKTGIDIRIMHDCTMEDLEFDGDRLAQRGGELYRNYYNGCGDVNVHRHALLAAEAFYCGTLSTTMLKTVGHSMTRAEKIAYKNKHYPQPESDRDDGLSLRELREISGSGDPDTPAYLGDGVWV